MKVHTVVAFTKARNFLLQTGCINTAVQFSTKVSRHFKSFYLWRVNWSLHSARVISINAADYVDKNTLVHINISLYFGENNTSLWWNTFLYVCLPNRTSIECFVASNLVTAGFIILLHIGKHTDLINFRFWDHRWSINRHPGMPQH